MIRPAPLILLDRSDLTKYQIQHLNFIATYQRHLNRPPLITQYRRRFAYKGDDFNCLGTLIKLGYVVRRATQIDDSEQDELVLTDEYREQWEAEIESNDRCPQRQLGKRLRQLRRIIMIAQSLRELPVCTAPELTQAIREDHGLECCLRTVQRDLAALEGLGFVELYKLPRLHLSADRAQDCNRTFYEFVGQNGLNLWPFDAGESESTDLE